METLYYSQMKSPIGPLWIAVSQKGLVMIDWGSREFPPVGFDKQIEWAVSDGKTAEARQQIKEYFDGTRKDFTLPLDIRKGTPFQRKCWRVLTKIPHGETRSYLEVAKAAGRPAASRAVGQANHHNPIPIVIPCHRVINTGGGLGGYGGGLDVKEQLLSLEGALPSTAPLFAKPQSRKAGA